MSENIRPLESDSLEVQRSTLFTPSLEVLAIGAWGVNFKNLKTALKMSIEMEIIIIFFCSSERRPQFKFQGCRGKCGDMPRFKK